MLKFQALLGLLRFAPLVLYL